MNTDAFETLTRSLIGARPGSTTRRGMTRLLGGLALGGPLALLGWSQTEAKCTKKCGPCKRCKKGKCKPMPAGTTCTGGTCQGGDCVPTAASPPPPPLPAPTCAETCPSACGFCFLRPGAPALCGDSGDFNCLDPCASDSDCLGKTLTPYCVSQTVQRDTGGSRPVCPPQFSTPGGFCSGVNKCT